MSDLLEELRSLAHEIATQPNAATADPYYTVQQRVRDWGIDPDYHEDTGFAWVMDGEEIDDPVEWCKDNDEPFDPEDPPEGMHRVDYRYRWEHVQAFLTQEAALAFMAREKHNHGPLRTWVESACRNPEIRRLRTLPARMVAVLEAEEARKAKKRASDKARRAAKKASKT